jgi:hypothetical protein
VRATFAFALGLLVVEMVEGAKEEKVWVEGVRREGWRDCCCCWAY